MEDILFLYLAVSPGLLLKQYKQDMIDDVIDENSPTPKSGFYTSSVPKTTTGGLNKPLNDPHLKVMHNDLDLHLSNGKKETSVDDIDEDEFFLGPGKQTYKVSSSITGQRLTEPFTSSCSTYSAQEDLTSSFSLKKDSDSLRKNGTFPNTQTTSIHFKSLLQDLHDISDEDDDEVDGKRHLPNGHAGNSSFPPTPRLSERRDSVGSDSTDYILNQAAQHLKHNKTGDNNKLADSLSSTMDTPGTGRASLSSQAFR